MTIAYVHMAGFERWTVIIYTKSGGCSRLNVNSSHMVFGRSTTFPHTWSPAPTCKTSSVPGRLYLETRKTTSPRCSRCFSLWLGARREHESLGVKKNSARWR